MSNKLHVWMQSIAVVMSVGLVDSIPIADRWHEFLHKGLAAAQGVLAIHVVHSRKKLTEESEEIDGEA